MKDADERLTNIARTLIKDHRYYEDDARTGAPLEYSSVGGLLMLMCVVPRPDAEAAVQRALETLGNPRTGPKRQRLPLHPVSLAVLEALRDDLDDRGHDDNATTEAARHILAISRGGVRKAIKEAYSGNRVSMWRSEKGCYYFSFSAARMLR